MASTPPDCFTLALLSIYLLTCSSYHFVVASSGSASSASSSSSPAAAGSIHHGGHGLLPLRYHQSPWLEDFIVRPEDGSTTTTTPAPEQPKVICDASGNVINADGEIESVGTCPINNECDRRSFTPSAHCVMQMNQRRAERADDRDLTVDELLSRIENPKSYGNIRVHVKPPQYQESRNPGNTFQRCHFLTESLINEMCSTDRKAIRKQMIHNLSLRTCRRFSVYRALNAHLYSLVVNSTDCGRILRELLVLDNLVEELSCEYESILDRFDCKANWSMWGCADCQMAYRDWMCSTFIPYHEFGRVIKPCQTVCEQVEQKCPHLHPYGKGQYAGEPVFLCIDPNIPFNERITPNTPYGEPGSCYSSCDLEFCLNDHDHGPVLGCEGHVPASVAPHESTTRRIPRPEVDIHNYGNHTETTETETTTTGTTNNHESVVTLGHDHELLLETSATTTKSGNHEATSPGTVEFSDVYSDELEGKGTSLPNAAQLSSLSDEDYYLIQAGSSSDARQSGQYLELEPNYDNNPNKKQLMDLHSYLIDSYEAAAETSTSNGNYQASFQDIYREALASTTMDSIGEGGYNEQLDKDIILNEELAKEDIQEEWTNIRSEGNIQTKSGTSTTTQSSFVDLYQSDQSTVPTGTETPKHKAANQLISGQKSNNNSPNGGSKSSGTVENSTNKYRHHNSRTKEQQQKNAAEHHRGTVESSSKSEKQLSQSSKSVKPTSEHNPTSNKQQTSKVEQVVNKQTEPQPQTQPPPPPKVRKLRLPKEIVGSSLRNPILARLHSSNAQAQATNLTMLAISMMIMTIWYNM